MAVPEEVRPLDSVLRLRHLQLSAGPASQRQLAQHFAQAESSSALWTAVPVETGPPGSVLQLPGLQLWPGPASQSRLAHCLPRLQSRAP
mmetsp:Transcript_127370/g.302598  ORF Transcript_127370/g.302598 Transcript_127370/m.302598 type:complete len:89 (+) Transcript_127370:63-329(+)